MYCIISSEGVEQCVPWTDNTTQQIDLAFNIFFMVYFFIRVRREHTERDTEIWELDF